ncbi:hypothetical protein CHARACLAT_015307 [Characodon lateralis]|uniref:Uncharacterized protein n=1 Tax=Characodon lateralis TaxID=208331 RepID=A0ABU7ETW4_9TELE|nr:hypothetical protein [Characodon lateralis]
MHSYMPQETGHLSYACPKNLLGEREPPKKKEKKKKKRAQQPEHVEEDEESEEEGEDPALDSLSQAIAFQGCRGTGAYLQQSTGERRVAPWTGRQSITATHRANNPYTHHSHLRTILERPINLRVMFMDCGRKPQYPEKTHACTGGTCKLHAEMEKPRTLLLQDNSATNCATIQLKKKKQDI